MTKFEKEAIKEAEKCGYVMAKSKIVFYEDEKGITFVDFNGTHTNFNFPWLEFAKNWHSYEEFQELLDKYSNLNDNYEKEVIRSSKLESQLISREKQVTELREADKAQGKEIIQLKSQLQQQALPVVPECVAKILIQYKGSNQSVYGLLKALELSKGTDIYNWIFSEGNQDIFALAFITGKYEVEKPQMFYLKNKLTGMYLYKKPLGGYGEDPASYIEDLTDDFKFTQKEIDGMDAQSYDKEDEYKGE